MPCTLLSILPIDGFSADDLPSNLRCTLLCIDYNREDDIQDHTELNVDNVQRRFTAYKAEVKKAAERKGQPLPPSVEKNTRILQFHNYKLEDDPSAYYDYYDLDSDSEYERKEAPGDCLPRAYSPSVTPVDQLTKTMIQGLQLETHHRGQYVLLKTITEMHNLYWAMVVVEDEDGDTLLLQLHNQGPYLESDLGTVFLVKEPYVTKVADGTFGIRVDHPADVKSIPQFHGFTREFMFGGIKEEEGKEVLPVDPSRNFWKQKGNELYEERKYGLATYCFTKSLEGANPRFVRGVKVNRALAYLKNDQFDAALQDAESVLRGAAPGQLRGMIAELALFRKAEALKNLDRIQECCNAYDDVLRKNPKNTYARKDVHLAEEKLSNEENADYIFRSMISMVTHNNREVACGTYIGPVEVRSTPNHGKGLFTTRAVKAGDLLLCEKAFALATSSRNWRCEIFFPGTDEDNSKYLFNTETGKVVYGTQADLVEVIAQKIFRNPSLESLITELHHGNYQAGEPRKVDGVPVVDSFLLDRIVELNCFGAPPITQGYERNKQLGRPIGLNRVFSTALWVTASRLNHSCFRNAVHSIIGEMFVLRAARDIPANTEVTIWYQLVKISDQFQSQAPLKLSHYDFTCDCVLCRTRQSCGKKKFAARRSILSDINGLAHWPGGPRSREVKDAMLRAIKALNSTYSKPISEVPRLELYSSYHHLTTYGLKNGYGPYGIGRLTIADIEEAVNLGIKALESLSFVIEGGSFPRQPGKPLTIKQWGLMRDDMVPLWCNLSAAYSKVAPDLVDQALAYAKLSYRICYGEDETFEHAWHSPMQELRVNLEILMW